MPIAQIIALLYAGMLIESPEKRKQFMGFINNAGLSVEKIVNDLTRTGGVTDNAPTEAVPDESEFQ